MQGGVSAFDAVDGLGDGPWFRKIGQCNFDILIACSLGYPGFCITKFFQIPTQENDPAILPCQLCCSGPANSARSACDYYDLFHLNTAFHKLVKNI